MFYDTTTPLLILLSRLVPGEESVFYIFTLIGTVLLRRVIYTRSVFSSSPLIRRLHVPPPRRSKSLREIFKVDPVPRLAPATTTTITLLFLPPAGTGAGVGGGARVARPFAHTVPGNTAVAPLALVVVVVVVQLHERQGGHGREPGVQGVKRGALRQEHEQRVQTSGQIRVSCRLQQFQPKVSKHR